MIQFIYDFCACFGSRGGASQGLLVVVMVEKSERHEEWWVLMSVDVKVLRGGSILFFSPAPVKHWLPFLPTPPFSVVVSN